MRVYGALFALSFIWGLSFVFMKWLLEPAGVWGIVFLRCLAGFLILLPVLWMRRKELRSRLPWKALAILGIFNAGLPWGLISLSETVISSSTASIVNATTPIFAGIIGFALFRAVLSFRQWLGIAIGFAGILILMNFQVSHLLGQNFIGLGTMVLASACYGFAAQFAKRYLSGTGVYMIAAFTLLAGALVGLAGMVLTEPPNVDKLLNARAILAVFGLGCMGSGIAYLLFYYLVQKKGPAFATAVTYLVPATAIVWGYVLLKEPVSSNQLAGIAVIFAGVYLSAQNRERETATKRK